MYSSAAKAWSHRVADHVARLPAPYTALAGSCLPGGFLRGAGYRLTGPGRVGVRSGWSDIARRGERRRAPHSWCGGHLVTQGHLARPCDRSQTRRPAWKARDAFRHTDDQHSCNLRARLAVSVAICEADTTFPSKVTNARTGGQLGSTSDGAARLGDSLDLGGITRY